MVYLEGLQNMDRMAQVLGMQDDSKRFRALADTVVAGYNAKFGGKGGDPSFAGSQTATAMPCALGAAPAPNASLAWLKHSIARANNHSLCGEIGWPYVVRSFASYADGDMVLDSMLSRTDGPSYGYMLSVGATTLTESWTADRGASWNHAMNGHIDAWFFEHLGGLKSTATGRPIVLAPRPSGDLRHVDVRRALATGILSIRWEMNHTIDTFTIYLDVPAGAEVHLRLPTRFPDVISVSGQSTDASTAFGFVSPMENWVHGDDWGLTFAVAPGRHGIVVHV